jgi:hypothetical protein
MKLWQFFILISFITITGILYLKQIPAPGIQTIAQKLAGHPRDLDVTYREFNEQYFMGKLPKDTIINFDEKGEFMATTVKLKDGRFKISFNKYYVSAQRVFRPTLLHEQCHIKTWNDNPSEDDLEVGLHTRSWISCMLILDMQGAFRREWIDYYTGN